MPTTRDHCKPYKQRKQHAEKVEHLKEVLHKKKNEAKRLNDDVNYVKNLATKMLSCNKRQVKNRLHFPYYYHFLLEA